MKRKFKSPFSRRMLPIGFTLVCRPVLVEGIGVVIAGEPDTACRATVRAATSVGSNGNLCDGKDSLAGTGYTRTIPGHFGIAGRRICRWGLLSWPKRGNAPW